MFYYNHAVTAMKLVDNKVIAGLENGYISIRDS